MYTMDLRSTAIESDIRILQVFKENGKTLEPKSFASSLPGKKPTFVNKF